MAKAKPTHMRPILEAAITSGELTLSTRKASRWALVTIDDLTARLAAAEDALAKFKCGACGKLAIALDTELCCCHIATISVATFPVIEDGCFTGDTLTIESDQWKQH